MIQFSKQNRLTQHENHTITEMRKYFCTEFCLEHNCTKVCCFVLCIYVNIYVKLTETQTSRTNFATVQTIQKV